MILFIKVMLAIVALFILVSLFNKSILHSKRPLKVIK